MSSSLTINQVKEYLPHRFPMLLIDRVDALVPGESVVAIKNVTVNEPCFQGHFPDQPVYPGALILESMAQSMAFITYSEPGFVKQDNKIYFFAGVDKARFKRQVFPGDQIVIETELIKTSQGVAKFKSVARVDGKLVCKSEIMGALRDFAQ